MISITIDIFGELLKHPEEELQAVVEAYADEFHERVLRRTPVRSGKLKAGWKKNVGRFTFREENDVDYAPFIENGTYKMAAQPMLRPTEEESDQILAIAVRRIQ